LPGLGVGAANKPTNVKSPAPMLMLSRERTTATASTSASQPWEAGRRTAAAAAPPVAGANIDAEGGHGVEAGQVEDHDLLWIGDDGSGAAGVLDVELGLGQGRECGQGEQGADGRQEAAPDCPFCGATHTPGRAPAGPFPSGWRAMVRSWRMSVAPGVGNCDPSIK